MRLPAMLLLVLCLGCANGNAFYDTLLTTPLNPSRDPTLTYYHAYGDSITYGIGLLRPAIQAYAILLSYANTLPLANNSYPGDMACDVSTNQIFPNADSPSLARRGLYTLLISTNDITYGGVGPHEAVFNLCHQASIAWLALPLEFKLLATSEPVATSGPNHVEGAPFNAVFTDGESASLSFPIQLPSTGPVYAWYRIVDANSGAFTCSLDGKVVASLTTATNPPVSTHNLRHNSLALLRLPAVPAGAHTLTFTQTSSGLSGMGILAVGLPSRADGAVLPRVLVGTTPKQLAGGNGACSNNDAPCLEYIADITANVALLQGDGLNVTLFDSRKYMTGTAADMFDALHPNVTGNLEILHSIEDLLD